MSTANRAFFCVVALSLICPGAYCEQEEKKQDERSNVFPVTVDYAQSLGLMISAGRYEVVVEEVSPEHFPVHGQGKAEVEVILVHFGRKISMNEVLKEFDRLGYRAATLPELLAFGAKFPDLQREFPIVEFGSLWQKEIRVAVYLRGTKGYRALDIYFVDSPAHGTAGSVPWVENTRFLAIRKASAPEKD